MLATVCIQLRRMLRPSLITAAQRIAPLRIRSLGARTPRMLLIKNGRVIDPASKADAAMDVLLDGELVKDIAAPAKFEALRDVEIFDAAGMIVAPGFIDLHAHLREPGQESSETIETGTK